MYSRGEIKALTDKVLKVTFEGGERAGTRFASSSITTNLVQYDQQLTVNVRQGQKQGSASTRELDDESLSDVTYNAITTDFWANLDALTGRESWQMFGTGGDAKGPPTQTYSISHGSPWLRIKRIMVGAAYA